jgi:hypothetical protein
LISTSMMVEPCLIIKELLLLSKKEYFSMKNKSLKKSLILHYIGIFKKWMFEWLTNFAWFVYFFFWHTVHFCPKQLS